MAKHHPFTCPRFGDEDKLMTDPGDCYARAYDMVLNGCELGGGSIRISDTEVQDKMLRHVSDSFLMLKNTVYRPTAAWLSALTVW